VEKLIEREQGGREEERNCFGLGIPYFSLFYIFSSLELILEEFYKYSVVIFTMIM